MKIYTLYSESHKVLFDDWFYPSLTQTNPDLTLITKVSDQFCSSGNYMEKGWKETMVEKDNYIIQSLEESNIGDIIIHSDVDVQFFKNIKQNINLDIFDHIDIACQSDGPSYACFGFMIMKNTIKLQNMFKQILKIINDQNDNSIDHINDQRLMNEIYPQYDINLGLLNYKYFSNWMTQNLLNSKMIYNDFNPVDQENIPSNLILHHANYVIGVQAKIDLMKKIKKYQNL